jgi:hypothetical protein
VCSDKSRDSCLVLMFVQPHGTRVVGYLSITSFRYGNLSTTCRREDCTGGDYAAVIVVDRRIATRSGNAQKVRRVRARRHATDGALTASPARPATRSKSHCRATARHACPIPCIVAGDWPRGVKRFKPAPGSSPTRPGGRIVASNTIRTRSPTARWSRFSLNSLA